MRSGNGDMGAGETGAASVRPSKAFVRRLRTRAIWALCTLMAMAGTTHLLLSPPEFLLRTPPKPEVPKARWAQIVKPIHIFAVPTELFGAEPADYSAWRHTGGKGRIDTLSYGKSAGGKPWMIVRLQRFHAEPARKVSFFVDLARKAAQEGLSITRSARPGLLATRFGRFEVADVAVETKNGRSACLGFRFALDDPAFQITGLACGAGERAMDRVALACVIDRIDLLASRGDPPLASFFAASEQHRGRGCDRQTAGASSRNWMGPDAAPPRLRGSSAPKNLNALLRSRR